MNDATLRRNSGFSAGPRGFSSTPPPSVALPPSDPEEQRAAEKLAEFVAKNGAHFEEITRSKNKNRDSPFSWLNDRSSPACRYYEMRLKEEQGKIKQQKETKIAEPIPRPAVPVNSRFKESATNADRVADMDYWMKRAREQDDARQKREREERELIDAEAMKRKSRHEGGTGHHMGDWIPKEELDKFMAKSKGKEAVEEFEAKLNRIDNSNLGHKMLAKMGWTEGQGLGAGNRGRVNPINAGEVKTQPLGVGADKVGEVNDSDDIYEQYKKRMMLGYKHRPNPLGNPRKAYY